MPLPTLHGTRRSLLGPAVAPLLLAAAAAQPSPAPAAESPYRASVLATAGNVAYWGLDERPAGSRAADLQGRSAGRYVGAVRRAAGGLLPGTAAARIDRRRQHVLVPHTAAVSLRAPWTLEALVRARRVARRQRIIVKPGAFSWGLAPRGRLYLRVAGVGTLVTRRARVRPGRSHHLAVRFNRADDATFFVDGRAVEPVRGRGRPRRSRRPLRLAGPRSGDARGLAGTLDEVALHARGLAARRLAAHARLARLAVGGGGEVGGGDRGNGEPEDLSVPLQRARPARAFVDSIGVNVHMNYNGSQYYENAPRLARELSAIGIRHVRDGHQGRRPDQQQRLNTLADAGIGITLIQDPRSDPRLPGDAPSLRPNPEVPERYGRVALEERIKELSDGKIRNVVALEGPNEYNTSRDFGDYQWVPTIKNFQCRLEKLRDAYLPGVALYGPSFTNWQAYEAARAAGLAACVPIGNMHPYPNDGPPTSESRPDRPTYPGSLRWHVVELIERLSGKPGAAWAATESGYHTAINARSGHRPVPESVGGVYAPKLFLEYFRQGAHRTFWYEAVDQWPNPQRDHPEMNFGLMRNDFTWKPAAHAVRNLIAEVSRPGVAGDGSLRYALEGAPAGLQRLLLRRGDGSYALVLWRDERVWDGGAQRLLSPPTGTVELRLGTTATVERTSVATGTRTSTVTRSLSVEVPADDTVVLGIRPVARG